MTTRAITEYEGKFRDLSNFSDSIVVWGGLEWPHVEGPFQASKVRGNWTESLRHVIKIYEADTPGKAKRLGGKVPIRPDWEEIKIPVMYALGRLKFSQEKFSEFLLSTGDAILVEGNRHHDRFWGAVQGKIRYGEREWPNGYVGHNWLGRLQMRIRDEIRGGLMPDESALPHSIEELTTLL